MEKFFAIIFVLFTILTGCGVSDAKLPETNFIMEFIADLDGNIEITNPDYPELADKVSEMVLCLKNDGSFTLKDKTKNQESRMGWNLHRRKN